MFSVFQSNSYRCLIDVGKHVATRFTVIATALACALDHLKSRSTAGTVNLYMCVEDSVRVDIVTAEHRRP